LASIGAPLGQQRIEAAAPVVLEPVAQGLGGDPGARAARDGVLGVGFLALTGHTARGLPAGSWINSAISP